MVSLAEIKTPARLGDWAKLYKATQTGALDYLLNGIRCGFRVGFNHKAGRLRSAKKEHALHKGGARSRGLLPSEGMWCRADY